MYKNIIRPILFKLPPELAHSLILTVLSYIPSVFFSQKFDAKSVTLMGLAFPHRIGLAAGFDKNGIYVDALKKLSFAFIEVGTVTPKPQFGNAKPRLFRLIQENSLINRMGFNNDGIGAMINALSSHKTRGIIGINIGKNKDTSLDKAIDDYRYCMEALYTLADYIVINLSSPNTPDLRQLQRQEYLQDILKTLVLTQQTLAQKHTKLVPLVIKCSPDETDETIKNMVAIALKTGIQGIIATNTTIRRPGLEESLWVKEQGGLSGRLLFSEATRVLHLIKQEAGNNITLIASGGIENEETAITKLHAGADLLQIYTGLIYAGPMLVQRLIAAIR